ncbi:MAG: Hg(II)-responsive transcriptional regulator [Gammaproteobacteria bacterium]|nr:MAG: Hg(II)-responsive transcriptional regulator [Gammaproteobacteria bacterium]
MTKPLTIGHLARATGINVETVRYYQRFGIITEPQKPLAGYRVYPADTVDRILFIRRAKELGFSLREIADLLDLGDGHCEDVRHRAEEKRVHIDKQIRDLENLRQTLDQLIKSCQADNDAAHCPIVETLAKRQ